MQPRVAHPRRTDYLTLLASEKCLAQHCYLCKRTPKAQELLATKTIMQEEKVKVKNLSLHRDFLNLKTPHLEMECRGEWCELIESKQRIQVRRPTAQGG